MCLNYEKWLQVSISDLHVPCLSSANFTYIHGRPGGTSEQSIIQGIESIYSHTVNCLNQAANLSIPVERYNFRKYWWDQELDELKHRSIVTHREWVNNNRPKQGPIFENKRKAKAAYKTCIRNNQKIEKEDISNNLHDALVDKSPERFWKIWNSKFGRKKYPPTVIDGLQNGQYIANKFADYFANTCAVNSIERSAVLESKFADRWINYSGDETSDEEYIEVNMLYDVILDLKSGKAAGMDNLVAEHLKHCHPIVLSILTKLFNLMLTHNYVPDSFGIGLTIPLPKHDSMCKLVKCNDFRGITISPVISKVFEHCLVNCLRSYLITSDLQFGFKQGFGCNHAIYTVRTTIEHFTFNNSTVNLCALDLASAFDKVNNFALFTKLMDRGIPRKFLATLRCWYSKVFCTVKWNLCLSYRVQLTAGVRQGGVLSPYLFAMYVDDVLIKLRRSSLG